MVVLETKRLLLRHMQIDDAGFMLGLLNEPSFIRFIGDRGVRALEDAQHYILSGPVAMYASKGFGFYMVEQKATAAAIGFCGLAKRDYLDDVDIGFAFHPLYWGKGYAYESAAAVLDYALRDLGLPRVVATVRLDNQASIKLLEKLGLRFNRVIRHPDGDRELKLFVTD